MVFASGSWLIPASWDQGPCPPATLVGQTDDEGAREGINLPRSPDTIQWIVII
jgi:hypothetical protein